MNKLRDYQHRIVEFILENPRCNLFVPMGLGKTVSTLTAIEKLRHTEQVTPVLVVAPLRVAATTWPSEVQKFPHLRHLLVSVVVGTATERCAALQRAADIYCTNYENLPWLVKELGDDWPFRMVVADECSKLKGFRLRQGTQRARVLAKRVHTRVTRYIGLTGTPAPNGLQDLWALMWMVDRGKRLGSSFVAFRERWFSAVRVGSDAHAVRLEPRPWAQKEIEDRIRDLCLSLDARDYFNLDAPIVNTISVALPPKARRLYEGMEREMFLTLSCGTEVEAFSAASKTLKCLQLANGAIYTEENSSQWGEVHNAKLQALEDIIEEASGMPVLVAYHFKSDLARLQKAFPQGRVLDKDPQTVDHWNAGEIPILFAHPASAGHGLNLQDGGNILVFFSLNWNLEERLQIIERIGPVRQVQAGHKRPVFIHNIVAADTVDELVLERVQSKREVLDLLLEAMKSKGGKRGTAGV